MKLSLNINSQTLAEWLDLATRGLVPSAQARVRAEIKAHYAEAVRTRVEHGLSEREANTAALADLGDASLAARRFRQEYLTKREVPKFRCFNLGRLVGYLLFGCVIIAGVRQAMEIVTSPKASPLPDVVWSVLAFACVALPALSVVIMARLDRLEYSVANLRLNHWGRLIEELNWVIALLCLPLAKNGFMRVFLVFCLASFVLNWLATHHKLLAARDEDLTPPDILAD